MNTMTDAMAETRAPSDISTTVDLADVAAGLVAEGLDLAEKLAQWAHRAHTFDFAVDLMHGEPPADVLAGGIRAVEEWDEEWSQAIGVRGVLDVRAWMTRRLLQENDDPSDLYDISAVELRRRIVTRGEVVPC